MKKIIDRNGRLFGFISVIDLLVIVVVALMGFALYTKNTQMAITSTNTADQTITYQILASGIRTYVAEAVREGDLLRIRYGFTFNGREPNYNRELTVRIAEDGSWK